MKLYLNNNAQKFLKALQVVNHYFLKNEEMNQKLFNFIFWKYPYEIKVQKSDYNEENFWCEDIFKSKYLKM